MNSIKIETVKDRQKFTYPTYRGRLAFYIDGKRRYAKTLPIDRLSRTDATLDAEKEARDILNHMTF